MATEIRELHHTDLPRPLIYVAAATCGVLAAMTVQILLSRAGVELASVWDNLFANNAPQLRSAGTWWLMVGSAFLVSAAVAGALSRLPWPWYRFRLLRWILGAAVVFFLADVGHSSAAAAHSNVQVQVAVSLVALLAASFMALFGAFFAARR
jgi:hypothetical protein